MTFQERLREALAGEPERPPAAEELERRRAQMMARHRERADIEREVMREIVRPRMECLTSCFGNAEIVPRANADSRACICSLGFTRVHPAPTRFAIEIALDELAEHLELQASVEIRPLHFAYETHDRWIHPLQNLDREHLTEWVEDRIVDFVRDYRRLQAQRRNPGGPTVLDPVCGMAIRPEFAAAQVAHEDRVHHFCMKECLDRFVENPAKYLRPGA